MSVAIDDYMGKGCSCNPVAFPPSMVVMQEVERRWRLKPRDLIKHLVALGDPSSLRSVGMTIKGALSG